MTATLSPAIVSTGAGGAARATGILRRYSPADSAEGSDCPLPRGDHSTGPTHSNILVPESSCSCKKSGRAPKFWLPRGGSALGMRFPVKGWVVGAAEKPPKFSFPYVYGISEKGAGLDGSGEAGGVNHGAKSMWAGGGVCGSASDGGSRGTVETRSCSVLTGLATGEATGAKFTAAVRASLNSLAEPKRSSERFCMAFARTALTASEMFGANMRTDGGCWRTCLSNTSTGV